MKRVLVGFLAAVLSVGAAASVVHAEKKSADQAEKKAKKKGGKGKKEAAVPTSNKITEAMTGIKWGMSREDLLKQSIDKVKEKYRPLIAKTKDAVEEDRLRQEAHQELDAIKKGVVDFDGRSTGWDVSFLKGEFAQNSNESMLVVRDANSQNFYFFSDGKLYKWYKAFDSAVFPAGNFGVFAATVQKRFGAAKEGGEGRRKWLSWQDKSTQLRAVDESGFYGFYCLVFEDKDTAGKLAKAHTASNDDGKKHAFVDAVTSERSENPDDSSNIADRISGRIRQNEQAPDDSQASASSGQSAKGKGSKKGAADKDKEKDEGAGVSSSDDPISGLGL